MRSNESGREADARIMSSWADRGSHGLTSLQADTAHDRRDGEPPDGDVGDVGGDLRIPLETNRVDERPAIGQYDQATDRRAEDALRG